MKIDTNTIYNMDCLQFMKEYAMGGVKSKLY